MSVENAASVPYYVFTWAGFTARTQRFLELIGMGWLSHFVKLIVGGDRSEQLNALKHTLVIPMLGILTFVLLWAWLAPQVKTSLGVIPGPVQVWQQVGKIHEDIQLEKEKEVAFYQRQEERNA